MKNDLENEVNKKRRQYATALHDAEKKQER